MLVNARQFAVNVVALAATAYVAFWALGFVLFGVGALLFGDALSPKVFIAVFLVLSGLAAGCVVASIQAWYRRRYNVWRSEYTAVAVSLLVVAYQLYRRGTPLPLVVAAGLAAGLAAAATLLLVTPRPVQRAR